MKAKETILAICYDFDKTLTPTDMQAQGYIQNVGYDVDEFWKESNALAATNDMDQNLAYMFKMIETAKGEFYPTREKLGEYGERIELFPGVDKWFNNINTYGMKRGVHVEHYVISSGLKEMIEGTDIAKRGEFKAIYANSFYFDEKGVPVWPAQLVNYTNKTQYLFRIKKGVLDVNDQSVNDRFTEEQVRIPFRNIIYIGDSDTDIPCMTVVNEEGGYSIGVYNSETNSRDKVYNMIRDRRVNFFTAADYTEGRELDMLIKSIIDKIAANEMIEQKHQSDFHEVLEYDFSHTETQMENQRLGLIQELSRSPNFRNTHSVIKEMLEVEKWQNSEIEEICAIAKNNGQVGGIITDTDIKTFFSRLFRLYTGDKKVVDEAKAML